MTVTAPPPPAVDPADAVAVVDPRGVTPAGPPPPAPPAPPRRRRFPRGPRFQGPDRGSPAWMVRTAMFFLAAVAVAFALDVVVVSQARYVASQSRDLAELRDSLANATVPVSQTDADGNLVAPGTPVALLSIPRLGLSDVVVSEGTSGDVLRSGPGHERDTRFPGQPGISIIQGRAAAYGGPFGDLDRLRAGDEISVVTGQDRSVFTVTGSRREGDPTPTLTAGQARLTLVTAGGLPFAPSGTLRVDAVLQGEPKEPSVVYARDLPTAEQPLGTMPGTLPVTILFLQGLVVVVLAAVWGWNRFGRWRTWIGLGPVVAVAVVVVGDRLALLLPNLL